MDLVAQALGQLSRRSLALSAWLRLPAAERALFSPTAAAPSASPAAWLARLAQPAPAPDTALALDLPGVAGQEAVSADGALAAPSLVLMAVPKRRTSHMKKTQRNQYKFLRRRENIVTCQRCGQAKLMHHLCSHCVQSATKRESSA